MDKKNCSTCKWFAEDENKLNKTLISQYHSVDGFCRRRAPICKEDTGATQWEWPIVCLSDWCGEWEKMETK